jgi:hypothetical protein
MRRDEAVSFRAEIERDERDSIEGALIEPPEEKSRKGDMERLSTGNVITVGFFSVFPNCCGW